MVMDWSTILVTAFCSVSLTAVTAVLTLRILKTRIETKIVAFVDDYAVRFAANLKQKPELIADVLKPSVNLMLGEFGAQMQKNTQVSTGNPLFDLGLSMMPKKWRGMAALGMPLLQKKFGNTAEAATVSQSPFE